MEFKWIGAVLLIAGFGYIGFSAAVTYKREESLLHQLSGHIEYMICELQYRQSPLPQLCDTIAKEASQPLRGVYQRLCAAFEQKSAPDVYGCMCTALAAGPDVPKLTEACLIELGKSLGHFDLTGQLRGLEAVQQLCLKKLADLESNRDQHIRSYQIFGLCAGAALAIILI